MTNEDFSFFLTKASANLAQQLHYHTLNSFAPVVIVGDVGVGKTAFIHYFIDNYLNKSVVHCIDLSKHGDISHACEADEHSEKEALWFFDHADACDTQQQTELADCIDEIQGRCIIVLQKSSYKKWLKNAQPWLLRADIMEQKAISDYESLSYCETYILQITNRKSVKLSKLFKFKVKRCHGNFKKLRLLLQWNENRFSEFKSNSGGDNRALIGKPIILVVLLLLVWIMPINSNKLNSLISPYTQLTPKIDRQSSTINNQDQTPLSSRPAVEKKSVQSNVVEQSIEKLDFDLSNVTLGFSKLESEEQAIHPPDKPLIQSAEVTDNTLSNALKKTLKWLSGDHNQWSKQLLVFAKDDRANEKFAAYLKKLQKQGVDTKLVHIYKFKTKKMQAYSVLYGEYDTKQRAKVASKQLPPILETNPLILRSANGIRNDINNRNM